MWIFTGDRDTTFRPITAQNMYTALQSAGATPRLTQLENTGHSGWSSIYANNPRSTGQFLGGSAAEQGATSFYDWLFAQSRAHPPPPAPRAPRSGETVRLDLGLISQDVYDANRVLIDNIPWLPDNPAADGTYWNHPQNTAVVEGSATGTLVHYSATTTGEKTTVGFRLTDTFNGQVLTNITDDTAAPTRVVGDGWYVGSGATSTAKAETAELVIEGLTPGGAYDVSLFAAIAGTDGSHRYRGWYRVNGVLKEFDASNNTHPAETCEPPMRPAMLTTSAWTASAWGRWTPARTTPASPGWPRSAADEAGAGDATRPHDSENPSRAVRGCVSRRKPEKQGEEAGPCVSQIQIFLSNVQKSPQFSSHRWRAM